MTPIPTNEPDPCLYAAMVSETILLSEARRLGIEGPYRTVARNLRLPVPERYIDWEDVDPLERTIVKTQSIIEINAKPSS